MQAEEWNILVAIVALRKGRGTRWMQVNFFSSEKALSSWLGSASLAIQFVVLGGPSSCEACEVISTSNR